jgi:hypothetical protein
MKLKILNIALSGAMIILFSCSGDESEEKAPQSQYQGGCFGGGGGGGLVNSLIGDKKLKLGQGLLLSKLAGMFSPASQGIQCAGPGSAEAVPPGAAAVTTAQGSAAEDLSNAGTDLQHSAELLCNGNSQCVAAALGTTPTQDQQAPATLAGTSPGDTNTTSGSVQGTGGPAAKALNAPYGTGSKDSGGGGAGGGGGGGSGGSFLSGNSNGQGGTDPNANYKNGGNMFDGGNSDSGGGSKAGTRTRRRDAANGGGAGGSDNPFAALLGGGDAAGGGAVSGSGAHIYGETSRDLASQTEAKGSSDPADYFSLTNQYSNIFKIVEKRYRQKQSDWVRQSL